MAERSPLPSQLVVRATATTPVGAVRAAGRLRASRGLPASPLRVLDSYAAVYLLAGSGRYADANGTRTALAPGDLLLLFPGLGHTYGPQPGQTWSELYLLFDGPVFDLWRSAGLLDPARPVRRLAPVDRWAAAFERVFVDLQRTGSGAALSTVCALLSVLADAEPTAPREDAQADHWWLSRASALLDADVRREQPLEAIAARLSMSYDGFRKRFRRLAGVSPARYRTQRCIDRACELLAEGELTGRQIAAALGFNDEFHFSRRFRQLTGTTPSQFRSALPPLPHRASIVSGRTAVPDGRQPRAHRRDRR
jgi:AraC-like DNA-binding protein